MTKTALLDLYADAIAQIRNLHAGTRETSFYPALSNLFDAIGNGLDPRVVSLNHVSGKRAGIPDFGLFERARTRRGETPEWREGIAPDRGVVEVKGIGQDIALLVASDQVKRQYLPAFGLVLATNLWQFRLVSAEGVIDSFDLAENEAGFLALIHGTRPRHLATRFADFLERCLLTAAPLASPAALAFFLASYARDALALLDERADLPALASLRRSMEETLELSFDARDGAHLFRSTLVQTLFYGLFSAWIVEARAGRAAKFDWRAAQWSLSVPIARFLFQQVATPEALAPLGIVPLLDAASRALARVDQAAFFTAFHEAQAVQYFYEPFLEYFDPVLRRDLGVWYTPPEIVEYMVERIDRVLRSELGINDGLADARVVVLDPCCGTGSFLVAVLARIRRTLQGKGLGSLIGAELKRAAMTRIHGFEIMTAPLVIAHWQIGEALAEAGAALALEERASVFLTNALTGWSETGEKPPIPGFEPLTEERSRARHVKREAPILVILGNPPYNAFAGTSPAAEGDLVQPYKEGLREKWGVKKFNLDDLYVRFFRIAERRIAEAAGKGIVCFISNYSWLSGASYVVMRQRLTERFDRIWIENMHGDRNITEYGPDGRSSETVFAIAGFSPGIRQGVATAMLVRTGKEQRPVYRFRDDINPSRAADRRAALLATLKEENPDAGYETLDPKPENRFSLRPGAANADYAAWPVLPDLAAVAPLNGLMEKRGGALMDDDRAVLEARMNIYLDPKQLMDAVRRVAPGLAEDRARFDAARTRNALLEQSMARGASFTPGEIKRYWLRPFEHCWAYVTQVRPIWNEPRPTLQKILPDAGGFLISRLRGVAEPEGFPVCWTSLLADDHGMRTDAFVFPISENLSGAARPNLSARTIEWLAKIGLAPDGASARLVWRHALAITYSPAYLAENAAGIRQGWPRVPLPQNADLLRQSAALGEQLAALLDPDTSVDCVTAGKIRPELAAIAVPTGQNFALSAGWGNRTENGVTMPGKGRSTSRAYAETEAATASHAAILGKKTRDIYLNETSFWKNIPEAVWETHIGGYQVLKKWLSYREKTIIGRDLKPEEIRHVMETARRLAAILLLGPGLDASFRACAEAHAVKQRSTDSPKNNEIGS
jgi:hypothetical protein